jgi:hypothetical protein
MVTIAEMVVFCLIFVIWPVGMAVVVGREAQ